MTMVKEDGNGTLIAVEVTPRTAQTVPEMPRPEHGVERLSVRIGDLPESGAANAVVLQLLSDALGVPISRCQVVGGHRKSEKSVYVGDIPPELVRAKLGLLL